ncbi:hypothetical protein QCN27_03665 [Cereibacter sp. SYSU M97828]|nr:hypothetical protein [Cereibacter flavus]
MPDYTPSLSDDALSVLLQDAPVRVASLDDLQHLAARLEPLDEWVYTMEVVADGKGTLEFAIMGLDGEEDWDIPMEPTRMRALLDDKIAAMRASGRSFTYELYFGETSEDPA